MKAAKAQVFRKIHKPTLLAILQRKNACSSLKKSLYKLFLNVTNNVYGMFLKSLVTNIPASHKKRLQVCPVAKTVLKDFRHIFCGVGEF